MPTTYDYDLFVIGAGSGGVRASRVSAAHGAKVVVNDPGGSLDGAGGDAGPAHDVVREILDAGLEALGWDELVRECHAAMVRLAEAAPDIDVVIKTKITIETVPQEADVYIDAEAAFDVSQLDETFQSEKWGEDAEAAERRRCIKDEIKAAAKFLKLVRG